MVNRYKPGDKVPASGIYRVTHDPAHAIDHEVTCVEGKKFPRCLTCAYPRFRQVQAAVRMESNEHFKLPKRKGPKVYRQGGSFTIAICLLLVGILGACFVRSAPDLANVRWIAGLAQLILFPTNPANEGPFVRAETEHTVLTHFFNEVGIALMVAVILGVCFELFMRRREERHHHKHIEEIEKTVLSSLLGYLMPASISDEVRRVFEEKIMRSNLKVTLKFADAPPELLTRDPNLIMVTVTIDYDLVNLTKKATRYTLDHGFEPILALDTDHNRFVRLKITRGQAKLHYWTTGLEIPDIRLEAPKPCLRTLVVKDSVEIGPGLESGPAEGDTVHVHVEYQVVRRNRDQDTWTTWLPADRLDVKAEIARSASLDLEFHLERTHPVHFEETQLSKTDRKWSLPCYEVEKSGEKEAVSIGVLPYQGFTLYWFPRSDGCGTAAVQDESQQSTHTGHGPSH